MSSTFSYILRFSSRPLPPPLICRPWSVTIVDIDVDVDVDVDVTTDVVENVIQGEDMMVDVGTASVTIVGTQITSIRSAGKSSANLNGPKML